MRAARSDGSSLWRRSWWLLGLVALASAAAAGIYMAWRRGEPKQYRPGQIGATITDLKDHGLWNELGDKTRLEYATYLKIFQDGIPDPARCASSTRPRSMPASCLPRTIPH